MSSPFESAFAAAAVPALLGTHGQRLVYSPAGGGPPRTIVGATDEQSQVVEVQGSLMIEDSLFAFVERDAVQGIDDPQLGDGLRQASDPPERTFAWHGDKQRVLGSCWTLRFIRRRPYQVGGNNLT